MLLRVARSSTSARECAGNVRASLHSGYLRTVNSSVMGASQGGAKSTLQPGGFSLIEMLVALVVLSLSLGVLYQAAMGATRNVRVAAGYGQAVMLAESMLAEHSYVTEENFSNSGQFEQYEWSVSAWPAPYLPVTDSDAAALVPLPLQYLQVIVTWPGGNAPRSLDLLTVVPLRSSAQ